MLGLPAHMVDTPVDSDAVQPTVKLRPALETVEFLVRFEEHLLGQVAGVLGVRYDGENDGVNPAAVAVVKQIEHAEVARLKTRN